MLASTLTPSFTPPPSIAPVVTRGCDYAHFAGHMPAGSERRVVPGETTGLEEPHSFASTALTKRHTGHLNDRKLFSRFWSPESQTQVSAGRLLLRLGRSLLRPPLAPGGVPSLVSLGWQIQHSDLCLHALVDCVPFL